MRSVCADETIPSATAPESPNPAPRGSFVRTSTCSGEGRELKIIFATSIWTLDPFIVSEGSFEGEVVKVKPSESVIPAPVEPDLSGFGDKKGEKNNETCAGMKVEMELEVIVCSMGRVGCGRGGKEQPHVHCLIEACS